MYNLFKKLGCWSFLYIQNVAIKNCYVLTLCTVCAKRPPQTKFLKPASYNFFLDQAEFERHFDSIHFVGLILKLLILNTHKMTNGFLILEAFLRISQNLTRTTYSINRILRNADREM